MDNLDYVCLSNRYSIRPFSFFGIMISYYGNIVIVIV